MQAQGEQFGEQYQQTGSTEQIFKLSRSSTTEKNGSFFVENFTTRGIPTFTKLHHRAGMLATSACPACGGEEESHHIMRAATDQRQRMNKENIRSRAEKDV